MISFAGSKRFFVEIKGTLDAALAGEPKFLERIKRRRKPSKAPWLYPD